MSGIFKETQIPQQKYYDSLPFPSVLSPDVSPPSLPLLVDSIKAHKPFLESLLFNTGAILFRGFSIDTASDFNDFVEAFGYEELSYAAGAVTRTQIVGRVYTANESPPDQLIPFHHEMNLLPEFPSKLFFFCEVEPETGGETPLVLSHLVHDIMKEKYPDFVQGLAEHGLTYSRPLSAENDPSFPIGRGWKSTYTTQDKKVAEERAAKNGTKLEWLDSGDTVNAIIGRAPAIKHDKSRNRNIWFNSLSTAASIKNAQNELPVTVTFGDGKPLPANVVQDCLKIVEEESVAIPWRKGDVLWIDNLAVLHARRPCFTPRRVLASLCK